MVAEIVAEMDYLRTREQKLRDTNESTNTRVKWFAFGTMGMLIALGAWQVIYLRAYFRCVWKVCTYLQLLTRLQVEASHLGVHKKLGAWGAVGVSTAKDLLVVLVGCRKGT